MSGVDPDWRDERRKQAQAEAEARRKRLERIARENPSLAPVDVEEWERREWAAQHPPPAPRCCKCATGKREIVRNGNYLGPCQCTCHGPHKRGEEGG